jgi:SAM-dependent methyltransferase
MPACSRFSKRFYAWAMARLSPKYERMMAGRKRDLLGHIQGKVLEIGPGTGPNLQYYPAGIQWTGIEPNPYMHPYLRDAAQQLGLTVDLRTGVAERMDIDDNSIHYVVSTLVLCSVSDVNAVLREILRVLRPGGHFLFVEHVAAPRGTWLRGVQRGVRPIWSKLADGCRPELEAASCIEKAGFENADIEHFRLRLPIVGPHIMGTATKADT